MVERTEDYDNDINNNNLLTKLRDKQIIGTIPYSNKQWEQYPFQQILNNEEYKQLLPHDSILRQKLIKIRYKYSTQLSRVACNYRHYDTKIDNDVENVGCICNNMMYKQYTDKTHKHVMTCDLESIQHYPELVQLFEKGSKFKSTFCADPRSDLKVMEDLCIQFIAKASKEDALPISAYNMWQQVIYNTFANITTTSNKEKPSSRAQSIISCSALQQLQKQAIILLLL